MPKKKIEISKEIIVHFLNIQIKKFLKEEKKNSLKIKKKKIIHCIYIHLQVEIAIEI